MPTPKEELSKYISISSMSTGYVDAMDLFSVRRYGAVAGTTESQGASIDAAVAAAVNAGSGVVFFPPGIYHTTALSTAPIIRFVGDNASFTTSYGGSTYTMNPIFPTFSAGTSNVTVNSSNNITISVADSSNVAGLQSTVASFTTSISYLYASDSSHATRLTAVEADVSSHATRLTNLESTVASHTTSLSYLYNSDSSHATRLTNLESTVGSHTTSITFLYNEASSHNTRIGTLETNVTANTSNITQLTSALNTHSTNTQLHTSIMTAAGDLISRSTAGLIYRVPVGLGGEILSVSTNGTLLWAGSTAVVGAAINDVELLAWMLA